MTDPTVDPAYYRDPFTYVCSNCGAVWRITAGMEPDDAEAMYERRDEHVCDPDVSRQTVEDVRVRAVELAASLPVRPDMEDIEANGPASSAFTAWTEYGNLATALGEELAIEVDCDLALLETARPHVYVGDWLPWEQVLWSAECSAIHASRSDEDRARQVARAACVGMPPDLRTCPPRLLRQALDLVDAVWDDARSGLLASGAPDSPDAARAVLVDQAFRAKGVL